MQKIKYNKSGINLLAIACLIIATLFGTGNLFGQGCTPNNSRIKHITPPTPIHNPQITSYLEYLPSNYSSTTTNYPLLIFVSGQDQVGSFCLQLNNAIPKVMNENAFPDVVQDQNGANFSYIVISPVVTNPYIAQDNVAQMSALITYLLGRYRIDSRRIYLTGFSWGAYMIMDFVTSTPQNAAKIAAVIPVANCFPSTVPNYSTRVANLANAGVDLWALQCVNDNRCATSHTQSWVNSINSAVPNLAMLTEVPACAGAHAVWDIVYPPTYELGTKNIYEWAVQFSSNFLLPVRMKDYTAQLNDGKVTIQWTTTMESNTQEFILERAGATRNFQPILTVSAAGDLNVDKKYTLVDDQPQPGNNLYRLSLRNRDGKIELFEIKQVNIPTRWVENVNIQNPSRGNLSVFLNIERRQKVNISLFDLNGRMLERTTRMYSPGITESKFDVSGLQSGTYLVRIEGDAIRVTRKVLIN